VEGMKKPCSGSTNKTLPKEIVWKTYPYRLFFGRESSSSWGPGGVAFLNPESKIEDKAHFCMYRITYGICYDSFCFCLFHFLALAENSSLFTCFVLLSSFSRRLEQFNDVLLQENDSSYDMTSPLFDLAALMSVTSKEPNSVEIMVCLLCLNVFRLK